MIKLGEICDIKGGKRLPKGHNFTEQKTEYKYVRARDIGNGKIQSNDIQYIDEKTYYILKNYTVSLNDVCITIVGANIGDVGIVTDEFDGANLTENAVKLTSLQNYNPYFLTYYLSMPKVKEEMQTLAAGAAQPKLGIYKVKEILVPNIEVSTQEKIVDIISKYDDLIENNLKRIALLEEAAESIYKEWFINFRFPGYEKCEFIDGVPSKWDKGVVNSIIEFNIGGGWGQDEKIGDFTESAYVIRGTDIPNLIKGDFSDVPYRYHKDSNLASRRLINGDIVFEASGGSKEQSIGRTLYINNTILDVFNDNVMCASFCKLIRAKSIELSYFLFSFIKNARMNGTLSLYESQSASNIINFKFVDFIEKQQILIPENDLLCKFRENVEPIITKIVLLGSQIYKLKEARDILLPKLIMGEIEV